MRFYVQRTRMAMRGTFYGYDVYIFAEDVPNPGNYFIYPAGFDSPKCVPLYAHYKGSTDYLKLKLLKRCFPELSGINDVPSLWIEIPMELGHESIVVNLTEEII